MQEYEVIINNETCIVCEGCIDTCGNNVLELGDDGQVVAVRVEDCTGGMECVEECPTQSIYVGESLEKRKADIEHYEEKRNSRKANLEKLLDKYGKNEDNEWKIPLGEVLEKLDFHNTEALEEWFIDSTEYMVFTDEEYCIVNKFEK